MIFLPTFAQAMGRIQIFSHAFYAAELRSEREDCQFAKLSYSVAVKIHSPLQA